MKRANIVRLQKMYRRDMALKERIADEKELQEMIQLLEEAEAQKKKLESARIFREIRDELRERGILGPSS
jgi:hypothetical protein